MRGFGLGLEDWIFGRFSRGGGRIIGPRQITQSSTFSGFSRSTPSSALRPPPEPLPDGVRVSRRSHRLRRIRHPCPGVPVHPRTKVGRHTPTPSDLVGPKGQAGHTPNPVTSGDLRPCPRELDVVVETWTCRGVGRKGLTSGEGPTLRLGHIGGV